MEAIAADKRDARLMRRLFCLVRQHRGLTQDDFAKELGIGYRYLQAIEYSEKLPSRSVLFRCLRLADGAPLWQLRKASAAAPALVELAPAFAMLLPAAVVSPPPLPPRNTVPQPPARWGQP